MYAFMCTRTTPSIFTQSLSNVGSYSKAYHNSFANFGCAGRSLYLTAQLNGPLKWSFTLGLALSCALDVIITASLCYFLLRNRKQTSSMNHVIDSLMLYAFENGSLTWYVTISSSLHPKLTSSFFTMAQRGDRYVNDMCRSVCLEVYPIADHAYSGSRCRPILCSWAYIFLSASVRAVCPYDVDEVLTFIQVYANSLLAT